MPLTPAEQLQFRVGKYSQIDKVVEYITTRPDVFFNKQTENSPKYGYYLETLKKLYNTCNSQINEKLINDITSKVPNNAITSDQKQQLLNISKKLGQQIKPYEGVTKEDCVPPPSPPSIKTITDYVNINRVLNFLNSSPDNRAYFISNADEDKTKYTLGRFVLYVYYYYGDSNFVYIMQQKFIHGLDIIQRLQPQDTYVAKIKGDILLYTGDSKDTMINKLNNTYKTIIHECEQLNEYIPNQELLEYIPPLPPLTALPENPFEENIPENTLQVSTPVLNECDDHHSFPQKLKNMSFNDYSLNKSGRNGHPYNKKEYLRLALLCHPDKTNGSGYPMQVLGAIKNNDDIPTKGGKRRRKSKKYGKSIKRSTRRRR